MNDKFLGLNFLPQCSRCPICDGTDLQAVFNAGNLYLQRCRHCTVLFVNPQPDAESLQKLYSIEYFQSIYEPQEQACMKYFTQVMHEINAKCSPGHLLEIGPGSGYFLRVSTACGWQATGVELSEYAAAHLREKEGFNVITGTLDTFASPPSAYDMVVMWDVLEHMQDPVHALQQVAYYLKPGGLFVLKVPNPAGIRPMMNRALTEKALFSPLATKMAIESYLVAHGFHHLFYFSRRSIRCALERSGLLIKQITSAPEPSFHRTEPLWKSTARSAIDLLSRATDHQEALQIYACKPVEDVP